MFLARSSDLPARNVGRGGERVPRGVHGREPECAPGLEVDTHMPALANAFLCRVRTTARGKPCVSRPGPCFECKFDDAAACLRVPSPQSENVGVSPRRTRGACGWVLGTSIVHAGVALRCDNAGVSNGNACPPRRGRCRSSLRLMSGPPPFTCIGHRTMAIHHHKTLDAWRTAGQTRRH